MGCNLLAKQKLHINCTVLAPFPAPCTTPSDVGHKNGEFLTLRVAFKYFEMLLHGKKKVHIYISYSLTSSANVHLYRLACFFGVVHSVKRKKALQNHLKYH